MHRGNPYPYLTDLWAVETTWWPYWAPRKFYVFFGQPQIHPEWSFITITDQVSDEGLVAFDRRSVRYDLVGEPGVWNAEVFLSNQFTGLPNPTKFQLRIIRPGIPPVSNRYEIATYTGPLNVAQWALSDVIPPFYDGIPLTGGCRPAVWSEV